MVWISIVDKTENFVNSLVLTITISYFVYRVSSFFFRILTIVCPIAFAPFYYSEPFIMLFNVIDTRLPIVRRTGIIYWIRKLAPFSDRINTWRNWNSNLILEILIIRDFPTNHTFTISLRTGARICVAHLFPMSPIRAKLAIQSRKSKRPIFPGWRSCFLASTATFWTWTPFRQLIQVAIINISCVI